MSERFTVIADHREDPNVLKALGRIENLDLQVHALPVGDYILPDCAIERKAIGDFLYSLYSGKLHRQLKELQDSFERPFLLLHGDHYEHLSWNRGDARRAHQTFVSTMVSIARMGIPIVYVRDEAELKEAIVALVRQADPNKPAAERPILTRKPSSRTLQEEQEDVLCSIGGIGRSQARRLLERFGSVKGVATAPCEAIMEMDGFGEKKASHLVDVFSKVG